MPSQTVAVQAPDRIGLGVGLAIATFAVFSTNDLVVKWVSSGYSVFLIAFFISIFALVPTAFLIGATGGVRSMKPRAAAPLVWLRAALLLVSTLAIYTAFRTLSMAEAYVLVFTAPLLITVLSVPMLGERVGWRRGLAVVIGFAGVLVMLRPGAQALGSGHLAAFVCALTFALAAIIVRRAPTEHANVWLAPMVVLKAAATAILVTLTGGWMLPAPGDLALLALAGLCYGSGHFLFVLAFRYAPATIIAPFHYSEMVWALIYGVAFFHDVPNRYTLIGAAIIVATGLYIAVRENALRRTAPRPGRNFR